MANRYVIDTHALIWYLEGNVLLGGAAQVIMDNSASELVLPAIALAEAIHIVNRGRTGIASVSDLLREVIRDARIEVYPLTLAVLQESLAAATVPEMHDRLIVATVLHLQSLGHAASLLTKDVAITTAALVSIIWS